MPLGEESTATLDEDDDEDEDEDDGELSATSDGDDDDLKQWADCAVLFFSRCVDMSCERPKEPHTDTNTTHTKDTPPPKSIVG